MCPLLAYADNYSTITHSWMFKSIKEVYLHQICSWYEHIC